MTEIHNKLTPESSLELLFDSNLIPNSIKNDLIKLNLTIRPLSLTDYTRNHTELLRNLTKSPKISSFEWEKQFNLMKFNNKNTYFLIVIINNLNDLIIGCGTLFLELKFIRGLSLVGHIEDICVDKLQQGLGLGKILLNCLIKISESLGTYKCILDCSKENEGKLN